MELDYKDEYHFFVSLRVLVSFDEISFLNPGYFLYLLLSFYLSNHPHPPSLTPPPSFSTILRSLSSSINLLYIHPSELGAEGRGGEEMDLGLCEEEYKVIVIF